MRSTCGQFYPKTTVNASMNLKLETPPDDKIEPEVVCSPHHPDKVRQRNITQVYKPKPPLNYFKRYNEADFSDQSKVSSIYNQRQVPYWNYRKFSPIFNR